ncbi:MAG: family 88 glycosyl hydrolase [Flavobacteriales bacterium]|nr:MAG: family 88 glycosyl hydrolase [Flavobacteriales bacterium]
MNRKILLPAVTILFLIITSCKSTNIQNPKATIEKNMVKALEWQEDHPIQIKTPMGWTHGAYYTGVARAHQATQNKVFLKALKDMGKRNKWQTGPRQYHADDLPIAYSYLYLKSIGNDMVNLDPTSKFIQEHLYEPNEWKTGTAKGKPILWWWCDALFMAPPTITLYAKIKDNQEYLDEMHKYFMETYNLLYDKEENLFARDIEFLWKGKDSDKKEINGKKIFWSRGNGWVLAGLALILEDMPKNYKHRAFYENLFVTMAHRIKGLQPEDGLWRPSLLAPEKFNHGEVSGSGFFTFALAWGINNELLKKSEYAPTVSKAWKSLKKSQHKNGKIGWVQNIGFDPQPANFDSWQNYGTGAFLLAGSEVLKLN